jgi:hypothetical protein
MNPLEKETDMKWKASGVRLTKRNAIEVALYYLSMAGGSPNQLSDELNKMTRKASPDKSWLDIPSWVADNTIVKVHHFDTDERMENIIMEKHLKILQRKRKELDKEINLVKEVVQNTKRIRHIAHVDAHADILSLWNQKF